MPDATSTTGDKSRPDNRTVVRTLCVVMEVHMVRTQTASSECMDKWQ